MASPYRETLPEAPRREIAVDVEPADAPPKRRFGLVAVLVAVALVLVIARSGSRFFFLPIIFPFGFGGGSLLRRVVARWRQRTLSLERSVLSLGTRALGASRRQSLDAALGVFVAIEPTGVSVNGVERADVRIVGASGALSLRVADVERAEDLRRRLRAMMEAAGFAPATRETPLRGGVSVQPTEGGEELSWETGRASVFWVVALPILFSILVVVFLFREGPAVLPIFVAGVAIFAVAFVATVGRRKRRTSLFVGASGWRLLVREGVRAVAMRSAPAALHAEVVSRDVRHVFGGMTRRETLLELSSEGDVVGTVGGDLSEPELRFLAERIRARSGV